MCRSPATHQLCAEVKQVCGNLLDRMLSCALMLAGELLPSVE